LNGMEGSVVHGRTGKFNETPRFIYSPSPFLMLYSL
ncbi:hypothetical protein SAMN05216233_101424, partial [Desulfoluna spongiiphila]